MLQDISFGYIDVLELLRTNNGLLKLILTDSALERSLEGSYEYSKKDDLIIISPLSSTDEVYLLPSKIQLTPEFLAFVGLYAGDGDKTGNVGFSQREMNINRLAFSMMVKIFGKYFPITWHILEDIKRFNSKNMRTVLSKFKVDLLIDSNEYQNPDFLKESEDFFVRTNSSSFNRQSVSKHTSEYVDKKGNRHKLTFTVKNLFEENKAIITSKDNECDRFIKDYGFDTFVRVLQENISQILFLKKEFDDNAKKVGFESDEIFIEHISSYVTKGARAPGKSSIVYMQQLKGSRKILPIWMTIIYSCLKATIYKDEVPWILLEDKGYYLDVIAYLTKKVHWFTSKGRSRYSITKISEKRLVIAKSARTKAVIASRLPIEPLIYLLCGFYLAEGDTKKERLFLFRKHPESRLVVGLTTSEHRIFKSFLDVISLIGEDIVASWKIKVGERYCPETEALALKLWVPLLRGGEKGQGYVRTFEIHQALCDWAIKEFPLVSQLKEKFRDVEITGAGIPRLHLRCITAISEYFLSLIVDLTINSSKLLSENILRQ